MSDDYDVIIIGSGAGGGTLAHALANAGKRILILERGDYLPRESANWDPGAVFIDGRYQSTETWYDADDKPFQPQVHYFVGGATKLYGAALYRLRPQDFGELHHVDGLSPAWPLDLRRLRALVHRRPSGSTRCTATAARTRPRATARRTIRGRRSRTSRASSSSSTTSQKGGYHPFHAPVRRPARRGRPGQERLHPLHVVRRLPVPGARQVRRRDHRGAADPRPAQRHAAGQRRGRAARHRRGGPDRHRRGGAPRRRRRDLPGRRSWSSRPARRTRPSCCWPRPTTATPTGWPTAPTRSAGTTCTTTAKRWSPCRRSPTTRMYQKTLGLNDFYLGAPTTTIPIGNIQMVGKSNAEAMKGEEPTLTKLAPHWTPGRRGPPRRRLLADHRGPAHARQPGDPRRRRQRAARVPADQRRRGRPALRRAAQDPEPHRASPSTTCCTRTSTRT